MDTNRFTEKAQEALQNAQKRAVRAGHQQVDVEHLLTALLEDKQGLVPAILRKADINVDGLREKAGAELERLPRVSGSSGGPATSRASSAVSMRRRRRPTRCSPRSAAISPPLVEDDLGRGSCVPSP